MGFVSHLSVFEVACPPAQRATVGDARGHLLSEPRGGREECQAKAQTVVTQELRRALVLGAERVPCSGQPARHPQCSLAGSMVRGSHAERPVVSQTARRPDALRSTLYALRSAPSLDGS